MFSKLKSFAASIATLIGESVFGYLTLIAFVMGAAAAFRTEGERNGHWFLVGYFAAILALVIAIALALLIYDKRKQ